MGAQWPESDAGALTSVGGSPQDLFVVTGSGSYTRLPVGTKGQVLTVRSDGTIHWEEATRISVKAWGAKGNGEGNDAAAIKEADATAAGLTGASVYFPPGHYRSTETLLPSSGNVWEGAGYGSFIDLVDNATEESTVVYLNKVSKVTIRDLRIEQANALARTGVYGLLRIEGCTGFDVHGCYLGKSTATGIWAGRSCEDGKIWGNTVTGTEADGIHVNREGKQIRVWGNYLHNTGDDAISVVSFTHYASPGGVESEPLFANCENVSVYGNVIQGGKAGGVTVWGGAGIVVSSNTINGVEKTGIQVNANSGTSGNPKTHYSVGVTIADNAIRGALNHGIFVTYSREVSVQDNRVYNSGKCGIFVNPVAVDLKISGNRIQRSKERGILVEQATSTEARLLEELFTNLGETAPGSVGIQGLKISDNKIHGTVQEAIRVVGQEGSHIVSASIDGNEVNTGVAATWAQIFLKYVDNFTANSNNAASGNFRGLTLESCNKGTVSGNQARGQLNAELTKVSCSEISGAGNSFALNTELSTESSEPSEQSLLAWAYDAALASNGTVVATAGTVHFVKLKVKAPVTVKNLLIQVTTGGGKLTVGQCFAALFSEAGALLSTTADQAANWQTTGLKTMALSVAQEVPAGHVYVAFFYNGETAPAFARGAATAVVNAGVSGTNSRFGTANAGRTTEMPAKLESMAAESVGWWAALS